MQYYTSSSQINDNTATTGTFTIPWSQIVSSNKISWEPSTPAEYYEKKEKPLKERSFVMIKPDAFQRGLVGEVLDLVSQRGLKLIACKTVHMSKTDCDHHYAHHVG